jgi:diaminohydroxyphosphoribosylaminopyrimidine deaminase/5-amino-6-(5-phosphoribosylamino)uracil reductase
MGLSHADALCEETWRRLLRRHPDDALTSSLYGPLIAAPTAQDGCFVLGRVAQSLDGRIATPSGASYWISGEQDLLHTHRLRALADAIVVGAGTISADDPLLTTRRCSGPSPVRVVIDTERRLGPDYRVFGGGPPTLLLCAADPVGPARLTTAEVVTLPRAAAGGLDVAAVIGNLAGLRRIFVEGGGITVSRFLAAGALDRLHVTVAPLLLGSGVPGFTLPCVQRPEQGLRMHWVPHRLGEDLLLDIPLGRTRPPVCT